MPAVVDVPGVVPVPGVVVVVVVPAGETSGENTVPIAYNTSSIENAVTQMLLVKVSSCGRSRLPSMIGSASTQPCITGTTIVGQRFCIVRRRSLHNSEAVSPA